MNEDPLSDLGVPCMNLFRRSYLWNSLAQFCRCTTRLERVHMILVDDEDFFGISTRLIVVEACRKVT